VIDRYYLDWPDSGPPTLSGNFWSNQSGDDSTFLVASQPQPVFSGEYFYYDGGNHAFGAENSNATSTGSVFEVPDHGAFTNVGANWFLFGAISTRVTLQNNIFLGKGTPLWYTGSASPTISFSNNTSYMSNNIHASDIGTINWADFAFGVETEQAGDRSGTFNYYNNLNVDSRVNPGGTNDIETAISLRDAVGSQITSADYNGHAGYDNSGVATTTTVGYWQSRGGSQIAGLGVHDVHADPLFANNSASLATWDTSLGGRVWPIFASGRVDTDSFGAKPATRNVGDPTGGRSLSHF
jgi:hypothetical protein